MVFRDEAVFERAWMELIEGIIVTSPDLLRAFIGQCSVEQRLARLTPAERVQGLTAKQIYDACTPEERDELRRLLL